jgi:hypothetical protein
MPDFIVSSFCPRRESNFRGYCDVTLQHGIRLVRCSVFVVDGVASVAPPTRMAFRGDGEVIRTKKGRPERQKIIRFDTPEAQQEWSDAVVAALRAAHPGALA